MIRYLVSIIVLLLSMQNAIASEEFQISNILKRTADYIRNREVVMTNDMESIIRQNPRKALTSLEVYQKDTSPEVRHFANTMNRKIAETNTDPEIRQTAINRLVTALNDPEPIVWQHAGKDLLSFTSKDFTNDTKAVLHRLLMDESPRRTTVLASGVADMKNELSRLETLLINESKYDPELTVGRWYGTLGWAARLARARMGSQTDIFRCIELTEAESDPVIRITHLLKDIAYIRHPEAIHLLRNYLESDNRLPSVKETTPGTGYSQYAIHFLAESIANFPFKKKYVGGYSYSEIEQARQWMSRTENWSDFIKK
ncbi:hypothetical protein QUF90_03750 [Desulfococcaceae bacterium HSG9]|nr:hypothetical protein [Desulfococcaceae bacterium HSG9]